MTAIPLQAVWLAEPCPYPTAWALQRAVHERVASEQMPDTLLLLEHPPTFTMGRRGGWANLRIPAPELIRRGFELYQSDRGGDITYHGPGQLVGYPIVHIARRGLEVASYVRLLEQAHIDTLAAYGIEADRAQGYPGVWHGNDKLTAIGVRISASTSLHGFALNVATQLDHFDHIVPCGLTDRGVSSMSQLLGRPLAVAELAQALAAQLARLLACPLHWIEPNGLPWPSTESVAALHADTAWKPEAGATP